MRKLHLPILCILVIHLLACDHFDHKAKRGNTESKDPADKGKQLTPELTFKPFSVRTIVKDFQNDPDIVEIKGVQTDFHIFYLEYCVYRGQKNRVLKGVEKIEPTKVNDYKSDQNCYSVSKADFDKNIIPEEKTNETAFFWNFEKLKGYDIYTCIKAPLRHYIIFDKNSDTVYHRIEELAN